MEAIPKPPDRENWPQKNSKKNADTKLLLNITLKIHIPNEEASIKKES
jgi:hypothetical protein